MASKSRRLFNPSTNSCPYRKLSGGESGHARQDVGSHQTDLRSDEIRRLIRDMSIANPLWAASRIHGEPLKLGIDVGQTTRGQTHGGEEGGLRRRPGRRFSVAMASSKIDNR
jgi:hypothetical protein